MNIKNTIKNEINQVLKKHFNLENVNFSIEYPPKSEMGDYSCNVAMVLAKELKKNSLELAEEVKEKINLNLFSKIEVVKPGFINFFLSEDVLRNGVKEILKKKEKFGQQKADKKMKIQVEFISANPTGPLTLANGRGGFSGDVLANVLELAGHKVQREYLVNDYGNQVNILGHSILKDKLAQYSGKYIDDLAKELNVGTGCDSSEKVEKIGTQAAKTILEEMIKPAVKKAGIRFDNYFSERKLHESGEVNKIFEILKRKNLVYEKEGAWWLKTSGELAPADESQSEEKEKDGKDRVVVKSDGSKTYFLADVAYHWNKFHDRKFDKVINLWGADHHGYVARMKSAVATLGYKGKLEILLMQLVRLIENGKEKRMSKRAGVYVLLEELVDQVGLDVTRFFFLMHANNKAMDFDLDLAQEKSSKNPAFYVQYAHARICSILNKVKKGNYKKVGVAHELSVVEKELIKELIKWPELIFEVAQTYEVHKICFYTISLADKFHNFYEQCKVIENRSVNKFRLGLVKATQQVLQNSLKCLGVSHPEEM